MTAKKFFILFILASLAGHALIIALTARIDMTGGQRPEKVIKVELKAPPEVKPQQQHAIRGGKPAPAAPAAAARGYREDSVALQNPGGPYESYLLLIRRRIEGLWTYPPQALSEKREGNAVIRFSINTSGGLASYYVASSSGSPILDEGALACVRDASPFAPLPDSFNLSLLNVTATFSYRMGN
jgi:TonB family protein